MLFFVSLTNSAVSFQIKEVAKTLFLEKVIFWSVGLSDAWPYVEMASWPAAYFEKNEAGVETT